MPAGVDLPSGIDGIAPKIPHYWWPADSGAAANEDAWMADLIAATGTAMIVDYDTQTNTENLLDIAVSVGSHIKYAIRTQPYSDGNITTNDPTDTSGDAASNAYQAGVLTTCKGYLTGKGVAPTVIFADCEIYDDAPPGEPERAAYLAARAQKWQDYLTATAAVYPGVPVIWYARGNFFAQVNSSNALNGQYSSPVYCTLEDPGGGYNAVFNMPERMNAVVGAWNKIGTDFPLLAKGASSCYIWLGTHYKRNNLTGGSMLTRTDANTGVIRFGTTPTWIATETIDVAWTGGSRTGMTITDITNKDVTVDGGTGTDLPGEATSGISAGRYGNVDEDYGTQYAYEMGKFIGRVMRPTYPIFYPGPGLSNQIGPYGTLNAHWWPHFNAYMAGLHAGSVNVRIPVGRRKRVRRRRR